MEIDNIIEDLERISNEDTFFFDDLPIITYLNTLNSKEIISLYAELFDEKKYEIIIRRNIFYRLKKEGYSQYSKFFNFILSSIPNVDYKSKNKYKSLINLSRDFLPKAFLRKAYNQFTENKTKANLKLASKISRIIYSDEIEEDLCKILSLKFNSDIFKVIVSQNPKLALSCLTIKELLSNNDIEDWVKKKTILEIEKSSIDQLKALKKVDLINYVYYCTKKGINVEDETYLKLVTSENYIHERGLLLWCIGQSKKRNLIFKLLKSEKKAYH